MPNLNPNQVKDLKTLAVIAVAEIAATLVFRGSYRYTFEIGTCLALLYSLHEQGAARRPAENVINSVQRAVTDTDTAARLGLHNAYRNISNAGAKVFDDVANLVSKTEENKGPNHPGTESNQALAQAQTTVNQMALKYGDSDVAQRAKAAISQFKKY